MSNGNSATLAGIWAGSLFFRINVVLAAIGFLYLMS